MNCKFCNAELEQEQLVCPACGKSQAEEQPAEETAAQVIPEEAAEEVTPVIPVNSFEEVAQELPEELAEETEAKTQEPVKEKGKKAPLILAIIAAVAALGCLAVLLMIALGFNFKSLLPRKNDIFNKDSYTVADSKAAKKGDVVIATMGGRKLTNAHLQIYYRMQVLDFLNYYGNYVSQLGLDLEKPLSEQKCYFDDTKTWEQYLLGASIENWQNYQAMALLAEENGFQLEGEWLESLEKLPEDLQAQAEQGGHKTVDELLKSVIGPACTEELYLEYVRLAYTSNAYYTYLSEELTPTEEEVSAYYDENVEALAAEGISREMGNIADVRHILICPKHETEGETTEESTAEDTYTEEEWAACLAEAEKILEEWKSGEATEDSFAELANKYTEDPGSSTTGGLYEDIAPGDSYVENFLNWTIDMNRQTGDTEIVKTEYGYHIMYYVEGEPYWFGLVQEKLLSDRIFEKGNAAEEKWPMKVTYSKIAISELKFS